MNQPQMRQFTWSWPIIKTWLITIGVIWLLGYVGLGWLVKSFLVMMGLFLLTPVIAFLGLRWWVGRNVVQAPCPVCQSNITAFNNSQTRCPSCGEALSIVNRQIQRLTSAGTIDVQVVDVTSQVIEDD